jgi:hypothetical protein
VDRFKSGKEKQFNHQGTKGTKVGKDKNFDLNIKDFLGALGALVVNRFG